MLKFVESKYQTYNKECTADGNALDRFQKNMELLRAGKTPPQYFGKARPQFRQDQTEFLQQQDAADAAAAQQSFQRHMQASCDYLAAQQKKINVEKILGEFTIQLYERLLETTTLYSADKMKFIKMFAVTHCCVQIRPKLYD